MTGCASTGSTAATREQTKIVRELQDDGTVILRKTVVQVPETPRARSAWKCRVAKVLHAGLMISANPNLAAVYVAAALD
jgi:hypothetical protein